MRFPLPSASNHVRTLLVVVGLWAGLGLTASAGVTLRVESVGPSAVPITGACPGTTAYDATVEPGTSVTLAAPPVRPGGWLLDHWEDGAGTVLSANAAVTATVGAAMTLKVVYASGARSTTSTTPPARRPTASAPPLATTPMTALRPTGPRPPCSR